MRLIDWAGVYLLVGVLSAVTIARKTVRPSARDVALTLLVWPLYVPVLLGAPSLPVTPRDLGDAHAELVAAVLAVRDPVVSRLLPSPRQLDTLAVHLASLDGKVRELDEVLARDDFDVARAERSFREAAPAGGARAENARMVNDSILRLVELRARAATERDELVALCRRLRMQVTVLRFAGSTPDDVGCVVSEILARVEGVGAAFDEAPAPRDV